ncbi:MAG: hypothetical protein Q9210_003105 [Variospora velana]
MSDSYLSTIIKILIMNKDQLNLSKTMRGFLEKCLDDLDIGIESNNGHYKVRTQQEAIARLKSLSDQRTCSPFNSSLKKIAWFRAYVRFFDSHDFPPGLITQETPRAPTSCIGSPPFEAFVRSVLADPTKATKQEVAELVRAGARYDLLCWEQDLKGKCASNEGYIFLLPVSISADRWEHDLSTEELVQARTHLHHLISKASPNPSQTDPLRYTK